MSLVGRTIRTLNATRFKVLELRSSWGLRRAFDGACHYVGMKLSKYMLEYLKNGAALAAIREARKRGVTFEAVSEPGLLDGSPELADALGDSVVELPEPAGNADDDIVDSLRSGFIMVDGSRIWMEGPEQPNPTSRYYTTYKGAWLVEKRQMLFKRLYDQAVTRCSQGAREEADHA